MTSSKPYYSNKMALESSPPAAAAAAASINKSDASKASNFSQNFMNENEMRLQQQHQHQQQQQQNNQFKRIFASSFQPTKTSSIRKLKYFFGEKVKLKTFFFQISIVSN